MSNNTTPSISLEDEKMGEREQASEVEPETNDDTISHIPFDPNEVKISTIPYTLGQLIDRLDHGEIQLDAEYQRLPNLWNDSKKSRLIESILLRLPIPTFYFDGQIDDNWNVIDGLQRVSTLKSFVLDKSLELRDMEFLQDLNGKKYDDLPRDMQRRLKTFPITIYLIEKGTPDEVKYNIFSRINEGGLKLTPQEIRNALHQGIAANTIKSLVSEDTPEGRAFLLATEGKIPRKRMEDRDFAARFVAFYLISYSKYEPDLNNFLNKGMSHLGRLSLEEINNLKSSFRKSMNTAFSIFGTDAFRKRFKEGDSRKPINKALFEVLSVSLAKITDADCDTLIRHKEIFKSQYINLHADASFVRSITQGTALKENVERRFKYIDQIIKATLNL